MLNNHIGYMLNNHIKYWIFSDMLSGAATTPVIFTVDSIDIITSTSDGWGVFACQNDGEHLAAPVGDSLWDHIRDPGTRILYSGLLNELRLQKEKNISFLYRCDGPEEQRLYRMIVEHRGNAEVRFTSILERSSSNTLAGYDMYLSSECELQLCLNCLKIHVGDKWVDICDALTAFEIMKENVYFKFTPATCPCS